MRGRTRYFGSGIAGTPSREASSRSRSLSDTREIWTLGLRSKFGSRGLSSEHIGVSGIVARLDRRRRTVVITALAALFIGAAPSAVVHAQTPPDPSDVAIVLDFSASILDEPTDRNRFAAALERIADRVDATSSDLIAGDTTVSIVQFAAKAADYPRCSDLKLLGSPAAVARFSGCLRSVAAAYRKGLSPGLTKRIGVDTNYVAAMDRAAAHLPADAVRPALILFTDGSHDVRGVPTSQVGVTRNRLFGTRSPFALLPVGMGLDRTKRAALEKSLAGMRIVRNMPPCVSGSTFDWPRVVFGSPGDAGNAVAVALQNATCTFTVEEPPPPAPAPIVGAVRGIELTAQDGAISLTWVAPVTTATSAPVIDYRARCRTGGGDWVEANDDQSLDTKAVIEGLTNGSTYECQVAAVGSASDGAWTAAAAPVAPMGRPDAPGKPAVQALDGSVQISVPPATSPGVTSYRYQCSGDGGATWSSPVQAGSDVTTMQIGQLTNGVQYVCRAYAANAVGLSAASALSDTAMPCGSFLECNGLLQPLLAVLGIALVGGLLVALVALFRDRQRGYVVAVVDTVHSINLGHGSRLGIDFVRDPATRAVTDVVPAQGRKADIRVRQRRGGRFEVTDRTGRKVASDGQPVVAIDRNGGRHQLILHAFATNAAATVPAGR